MSDEEGTHSREPSGGSSGRRSPYKIGDKVKWSDHVATIRYLGETEFASGLWAGLELATPDGKHNGEVRGKRYFTCKPSHGVFVKRSQLHRPKDRERIRSSGEERNKQRERMRQPEASKSRLKKPSRSISSASDAAGAGAAAAAAPARGRGALKRPSTALGKIKSSARSTSTNRPPSPANRSRAATPTQPRGGLRPPRARGPASGSGGASRTTTRHTRSGTSTSEVSETSSRSTSRPVSPSSSRAAAVATAAVLSSAVADDDESDAAASVSGASSQPSNPSSQLSAISAARIEEIQARIKAQMQSRFEASLADLRREKELLRVQTTSAQDDLHKSRLRIIKLTETVERVTLERTSAEEEVRELRTSAEELQDQVEMYALDVEIMREQEQAIREEVLASLPQDKEESAALAEQNRQLADALRLLTEKFKQVESARDSETARAEAERVRVAQLRDRVVALEATRSKLQAANKRVEALTKQMEDFRDVETTIHSLRENNERLEQRLEAVDSDLQQHRELLETATLLESEHEENEQQFQEQLDRRNETVEKLMKQLQRQVEKQAQLHKRMHVYRERSDMLRSDNQHLAHELLKMSSQEEASRKRLTQLVSRFTALEGELTQARHDVIQARLTEIARKDAEMRLTLVRGFIPYNVVVEAPSQELLLLLTRLQAHCTLLEEQMATLYAHVQENVIPGASSVTLEQARFAFQACAELAELERLARAAMHALSHADVASYRKIGAHMSAKMLESAEEAVVALTKAVQADDFDEQFDLQPLQAGQQQVRDFLQRQFPEYANRFDAEQSRGKYTAFSDVAGVVTKARFEHRRAELLLDHTAEKVRMRARALGKQFDEPLEPEAALSAAGIKLNAMEDDDDATAAEAAAAKKNATSADELAKTARNAMREKAARVQVLVEELVTSQRKIVDVCRDVASVAVDVWPDFDSSALFNGVWKPPRVPVIYSNLPPSDVTRAMNMSAQGVVLSEAVTQELGELLLAMEQEEKAQDEGEDASSDDAAAAAAAEAAVAPMQQQALATRNGGVALGSFSALPSPTNRGQDADAAAAAALADKHLTLMLAFLERHTESSGEEGFFNASESLCQSLYDLKLVLTGEGGGPRQRFMVTGLADSSADAAPGVAALVSPTSKKSPQSTAGGSSEKTPAAAGADVTSSTANAMAVGPWATFAHSCIQELQNAAQVRLDLEDVRREVRHWKEQAFSVERELTAKTSALEIVKKEIDKEVETASKAKDDLRRATADMDAAEQRKQNAEQELSKRGKELVTLRTRYRDAQQKLEDYKSRGMIVSDTQLDDSKPRGFRAIMRRAIGAAGKYRDRNMTTRDQITEALLAALEDRAQTQEALHAVHARLLKLQTSAATERLRRTLPPLLPVATDDQKRASAQHQTREEIIANHIVEVERARIVPPLLLQTSSSSAKAKKEAKRSGKDAAAIAGAAPATAKTSLLRKKPGVDEPQFALTASRSRFRTKRVDAVRTQLHKNRTELYSMLGKATIPSLSAARTQVSAWQQNMLHLEQQQDKLRAALRDLGSAHGGSHPLSVKGSWPLVGPLF